MDEEITRKRNLPVKKEPLQRKLLSAAKEKHSLPAAGMFSFFPFLFLRFCGFRLS
ncbi:hypothetical protein [Dialister invisus]|uniref:hypothetical protein n=1 Tax=Dialister invisus TaxID=218538 RepID=UPI003A8FE0A7